ncbi:MAG TPA: glycosyltransferase family A protein [Candidatus Moranbacteria bacterium]|nr:glycosyltransferase family A protein [Candidatus Moranbacteria bacterium]HRZ33331.1 glycosyltransferase family A protein [Candidatus Moranbacteria bacterium]
MADANDYFIYIIIPTYNREKMIKRALDSVISQSFKNWKAIVVDDGSTDGTKLVVNEYSEKNKDKIIYKYKKNGGSGSARNLGIETVLAENPSDNALISFLDSDDALLPGALEFAVNKIKEHPEIKIFGFSYQDDFGKRTSFLLKEEMILSFEQIINKKNVHRDFMHFLYVSVFKENLFRFHDELNGGEQLLYWNIYKKYKTLFSGEIVGIYYQDSFNSLQRSILTQDAISNQIIKNKLVIDKFEKDLKKYNQKHLGELYLVLARMKALSFKNNASFSDFLNGIRYNPFDFRRIFLYALSLFDKKLLINNFLVNYFRKKP